jgi:CDP-diacylglycerol--glycerol-3-phosphate 3-phosphatidyltransferase
MRAFLTLPNILSLLRIPLAFLFVQGNEPLRVAAIVIAGLTDAFDGFLARRYGISSRLGTILDPLTDKLFVMTALVVLIFENKISYLETAAFLSRDIAVALFGAYLVLKGLFGKYRIEAFWCGKIFTTLQLFVLLMLAAAYPVPGWLYVVFVVLGGLSLIELRLTLPKQL